MIQDIKKKEIVEERKNRIENEESNTYLNKPYNQNLIYNRIQEGKEIAFDQIWIGSKCCFSCKKWKKKIILWSEDIQEIEYSKVELSRFIRRNKSH